MAGGGGPGAEHELGMMSLRDDVEPRRWDRRTSIRFAFAFAPLVIFAALGFLVAR